RRPIPSQRLRPHPLEPPLMLGDQVARRRHAERHVGRHVEWHEDMEHGEPSPVLARQPARGLQRDGGLLGEVVRDQDVTEQAARWHRYVLSGGLHRMSSKWPATRGREGRPAEIPESRKPGAAIPKRAKTPRCWTWTLTGRLWNTREDEEAREARRGGRHDRLSHAGRGRRADGSAHAPAPDGRLRRSASRGTSRDGRPGPAREREG